MKFLTAVLLATALLATQLSFADDGDDDSMIQVNPAQSAYNFVQSSEETVTSDTHTITAVNDKVVKVKDNNTGVETLVGLNKDKKQALLDVIVAAQFPVIGGEVSIDFLRTIEIGVEAGVAGNSSYGAFSNLHIIKFKVNEIQNDVYFGGHYRQMTTTTDCAILVECYGSLHGAFGDLRVGLRQTGLGDDDRLIVSYELGYGKFLNGGGIYEQKHDDYAPNGHHTGDVVQKQNLVFRVVVGYRLFSK